MIQLSEKELRDRIYACWQGKSIGGTMGTPFEGTKDLLDIQGFTSPPGVALPNDDLDLQLIWLKAMDDLGPANVDAKVLGEYWLSYIGPNWNEYGVGKSNLREGLLPPLSGEMFNEEWKHSNGAWIRTEIWACLYPAQPDKAITFAFEDACVDHGYGEGSYAAIFVAALQSAAFAVQNLGALLEIGLSKISADCRTARAVRLVMEDYAKGTDWKTARNNLVADSQDLGWFQAPANVAYVVLGLLYGEGDFKKSMILAINCGDDTDCTGATIGALMGIMTGTAGIPKDWLTYIGEEIVTKCVLKGHGEYPENCTQLTDCVMNLLPVTSKASVADILSGKQDIRIIQEDVENSTFDWSVFKGDSFVREMFSRTPYSFRVRNPYAETWIAFDHAPVLAPGKSLEGTVSVAIKTMPEQKHFHLRWLTPQGITVQGGKNLHANAEHSGHKQNASARFCITAALEAEIGANNRLILEITSPGRALPILVPIVILG